MRVYIYIFIYMCVCQKNHEKINVRDGTALKNRSKQKYRSITTSLAPNCPNLIALLIQETELLPTNETQPCTLMIVRAGENLQEV